MNNTGMFPSDYPMNFNSHRELAYLLSVPVKNQKHCDMCWAIVGTDTVAMGLAIRHPFHEVVPLLSTDVLSCAAFQQSHKCYCNFLNASFVYMAETGVMKETQTNPFVPRKFPCLEKTLNQEYDLVTIEGFEWLNVNNERELMDAVRISPIAVGFNLTEEFMNLKEGIYTGSDNYVRNENGSIVKHAIVIIGFGFDPTNYTRFWIVKNSGGPEWGEFGFGCIARASSLQHGTPNLVIEAVRPLFDKKDFHLVGKPTGYWYILGMKYIYHR